MEKFYITAAIPYVNAAPHIGHALEFVQVDAIKKFHELKGEYAFFTTGSDENSLKNVQSAEAEGISTSELCSRNAKRFQELLEKLHSMPDAFLRSSASEYHKRWVQEFWKKCDKNGDIYKKKYSGLYCVGCEVFYKESELENGKCPEHQKKPELVEEENYFFRLSKYQDELFNLIENNKLKIIPETRKNEVISFIKQGLEDFSISRSHKRAHGWGIPVPGDDTQIMYVWFDALNIYISALGDKKRKLWPADVHAIGKGILRFHAVYWPAMLLSAGEKLPETIFTHGYINVEGQKMSKSIGNVVDPFKMVDKYGTNALRYFLLREISPFEDGNFSQARLVEVFNNELVANLGNFVNRTLSFIHRYFGGEVPEKTKVTGEEDLILEEITKTINEYESGLDLTDLKSGINSVMKLSSVGNKYFQNQKPWELVKEDKERAATVLHYCTNLCRTLATLLYPYIPESSEKILRMLNTERTNLKNAGIFRLKAGHKISKPEIVFSKLEVKK